MVLAPNEIKNAGSQQLLTGINPAKTVQRATKGKPDIDPDRRSGYRNDIDHFARRLDAGKPFSGDAGDGKVSGHA